VSKCCPILRRQADAKVGGCLARCLTIDLEQLSCALIRKAEKGPRCRHLSSHIRLAMRPRLIPASVPFNSGDWLRDHLITRENMVSSIRRGTACRAAWRAAESVAPVGNVASSGDEGRLSMIWSAATTCAQLGHQANTTLLPSQKKWRRDSPPSAARTRPHLSNQAIASRSLEPTRVTNPGLPKIVGTRSEKAVPDERLRTADDPSALRF
jgi:hypothetical protein